MYGLALLVWPLRELAPLEQLEQLEQQVRWRPVHPQSQALYGLGPLVWPLRGLELRGLLELRQQVHRRWLQEMLRRHPPSFSHPPCCLW